MQRLVAVSMAFCVLAQIGSSTALASAYSEAVRKYCRADYKKYCGQYGLETNALRNCMKRHGDKLSKSCVRALVQSGEVNKGKSTGAGK